MSAVADSKDGTIYAAIDIDAPAQAVWDALTVPGQLTSWWGADQSVLGWLSGHLALR